MATRAPRCGRAAEPAAMMDECPWLTETVAGLADIRRKRQSLNRLQLAALGPAAGRAADGGRSPISQSGLAEDGLARPPGAPRACRKQGSAPSLGARQPYRAAPHRAAA
jgi:hypothetical protein